MHDLPNLSERRYAKIDAYGSDLAHHSIGGCLVGVPVDEYKQYACSADGYTSDLSWGYRLRAELLYPDLVAGLTISPT